MSDEKHQIKRLDWLSAKTVSIPSLGYEIVVHRPPIDIFDEVKPWWFTFIKEGCYFEVIQKGFHEAEEG